MKKLIVSCLVIAVVAIGTSQATVNLGTAANFAVLAGTPSITNTGNTTITGNVGIYPAASITGKETITLIGGSYYEADIAGVALTAKNDLTAAYDILAAMPVDTDFTATPTLGGRTLTAGVYHFGAAADLTGILTLSGTGDFVFQIGSALTTASGSSVLASNGANVYWQVGSSATLGTGTAFKGSILALTSIGLNTGATILDGRALARNGAVTLDSNIITVPEPVTICILGLGALGLIRRKK